MTNMAIGVDVGGTKIYVGLVDRNDGNVVDYLHFLKADYDNDDAVLHAIASHIAILCKKHQQEFAVGIAVPELVDNQGCIQSRYNYDWINKEKQFTNNPYIIESDVRAAALAEKTFGAAQKALSSIYISLGTGVSYSFILHDAIWRGHKGNAIHFASSQLFIPNDTNPFNAAPKPICFEDIIAGKGFNQYIKSIMGEQSSSHDWCIKLQNNDALAVQIAQYHAQYFGSLLAQLINIFDPEQIVLGGGLGLALYGGIYKQLLDDVLAEHIFAHSQKNIPIIKAELQSFSVLIGAALSAI